MQKVCGEEKGKGKSAEEMEKFKLTRSFRKLEVGVISSRPLPQFKRNFHGYDREFDKQPTLFQLSDCTINGIHGILVRGFPLLYSSRRIIRKSSRWKISLFTPRSFCVAVPFEFIQSFWLLLLLYFFFIYVFFVFFFYRKRKRFAMRRKIRKVFDFFLLRSPFLQFL